MDRQQTPNLPGGMQLEHTYTGQAEACPTVGMVELNHLTGTPEHDRHRVLGLPGQERAAREL
jgi:hypothetical protein